MISNTVEARAKCLCCGKPWGPADSDEIRTNVAAHQRIWAHTVKLTVTHTVTFRVVIKP